MSEYTSFRIGGAAKYFYDAKNIDDFLQAVKAAENSGLSYFILGGGTNILVSDQGYDGIVILSNNQAMEFTNNLVHVGPGVTVANLLEEAHKKGLGGIEFMAGIPGSVGGAIRGNAGAYGRALGDFGDVVQSVTVYKDGKIEKLTQQEMRFSYRSSVVKLEGGIILEALLKLQIKDPEEILSIMNKNLEYRYKRTPSDVQSAGSVFKNIELSKTLLNRKRILKELDITKEEFAEVTKYDKLPVSYINDKLGHKGKTIGRAQVSKLHGGYIINLGGAKADHVLQLIAFIKTRVRDKLGIHLEEEIQFVGF